MHEMRLNRRMDRMHSRFAWQAVCLACVAWAASGDDVGPLVRPAARQRDQMIARQRLTRPELDLHAPAVLAAITIAGKQECVRHLAAETSRNVYEARETDHRRARQSQPLRAHYTPRVGLDNLGLAVDHEPERAPHRHHRQGLERCIQCQTTYDQALLQFALLRRRIYNGYRLNTRGNLARHMSQPPVRIGDSAFRYSHVLLLNRERDGSRLACPHRYAIDRADRCDLDGSAREEELVGQVEHLSRNGALDDA